MELRHKNHIEHYTVDGEYYDYFAFDKFLLDEIRRRYEEFFRLLRPMRGDRVLEVGSGGGGALVHAKRMGLRYVPLDISHRNLSRIKAKAGFPVSPVAGDAFRLPFRDAGFDAVLLSEVLEHLEDPDAALAECSRVLKARGALVLSVPYKEKITYEICIHCNKPTPVHAHLHSFDPDSLRARVSRAGFEPQRLSKSLNKVFNRLHLSYWMRRMPFAAWKAADRTFNRLIDKPTSMVLLSRKRES
ncbi:MAG: class I SAM-dependent methyltransferase [Candidatus Eisenbacteria bacterium]